MSSSNDLDLDGKKVFVNLDRDSIYKQVLLKVIEEGFKQITLRLESISLKLSFLENKIENKFRL